MEGTPNRKPPHLSVFARALPLSRSLQLSIILRVLLVVQAHTFNVVERTGHRRFSSVSLTMSTAKLVPSPSVGFRTYLAIVTGGFCTCLAIVPVSAAVFHVRIIGSAEALPILCVSDFCERERERERERETPVTSFDITLKSRVIMHMITSTARRPNASTRSEPVECSCIRQGAWCLSARGAGNGRVIYE